MGEVPKGRRGRNSLSFSQNQNRIERQQKHQADIRNLLVYRAAKSFVNSVIRDPQNEEHIPRDGKIFYESGKVGSHFTIFANSSGETFACLRMLRKVPIATSLCKGMTQPIFPSDVDFFITTWLPR